VRHYCLKTITKTTKKKGAKIYLAVEKVYTGRPNRRKRNESRKKQKPKFITEALREPLGARTERGQHSPQTIRSKTEEGGKDMKGRGDDCPACNTRRWGKSRNSFSRVPGNPE